MKISYNWLKQFINTDWDADKTAELLTDLGLEVEGIEDFISIPGGLEGVVVGKVVACEKHPNADKLKLTRVDLGEGEPVQIVCGAPNVDKGQKVPVATIGTTLYDKEGKPFKIKKGKIRGEESHGMICAEDELGLSDDHEGIMVLDSKLKPGTPAADIFEIERDSIFEIGLTPNRADAMSHWGVARDLRAGMIQQEVTLELITPSTTNFRVDNRMLKMEVEVEDNSLAPRYCGVTISGLKVGSSPAWIQNRLKAIGLSPINNIVDITNYVLHELGQPLHAFDAHKITSNKVHVKTLPAGTKFVTLDGVERTLHKEDLMICDGEKPMCIAGVFGGIDSGVSESTTQIFLESAYFDPVSVRKTSKRHGLNTDASFRFERGIDPNITEYALMRAAIMILEIAGGEITSDIVDIYPKKIEDHQVVLNFENATRLIGQEIPNQNIKEILTSLEIKVNNVTETGIGMTIPAYRNDVTREADVIEEILRVYGYNNIEFTSKLNATIVSNGEGQGHKIRNMLAAQLAGQGFHEMINNSFTSAGYTELIDSLDEDANIPLLNPLSQDLAVMRQSMLFGALETLAYNNNRKTQNVKFYEFGKTYAKKQKDWEETEHLCLLISGNRNEDSWTIPSRQAGFFFGKGTISSLLSRLGITNPVESPVENDLYSEGLQVKVGDTLIVEYGIVRKRIIDAFGVDNEVFYADFNWDVVMDSISAERFNVKSISKYPQVKRDFALLLDETVKFESLKEAAFKAERNLLKEVTLFDVYTGKNLPKGKKSYALSFTLLDERKTLTDKQIDKIMNKLQQRFESDFGASLR